MVFRCLSLVSPLKLRNADYKPFVGVLLALALLQGCISILPFSQGISFIHLRYEYSPNYGECEYSFDADVSPFMMWLIDGLWWGPFITCVVSCTVFVLAMNAQSHKMLNQGSNSGALLDAKKKTVQLTIFFICCYLPKVVMLLVFFLIDKEVFPQIGLWLNDQPRLTMYFFLVSNYLLPAARAAFSPIMLRLPKFISLCNTSRNTQHSLRTRMTSIQRDLSDLKDRIVHIKQ